MPKYSIIIPALNEEKILPELFSHLNTFNADFDIILSDGNSSDNTIGVAKSYNAKTCNNKPGRGIQMNDGAECSKGEILIFLHADTFLPDNVFKKLDTLFSSKDVDIALFRMNFNSSSRLMKLYSWFSRFDSVFTSFGDQVIVIRRKYFFEIGGFPNIPLFEDVELLRRVRRQKKIHKISIPVTTSARRFDNYGKIKTQILNTLYIIQFLLGKEPHVLYDKYFRKPL